MSLRIIKTGLFDTIQDMGRYGYQHLGINPGGSMDRYAAQVANALLGKEADCAVIELHFPAARILFEADTVICITGADMTPLLNEKEIPLHQPVKVKKNDHLHFHGLKNGARCYLAMIHSMKLEKWLGSYSTNTRAGAGGVHGRVLRKDDVIEFEDEKLKISDLLKKSDITAPLSDICTKALRFIIGHEYDLLEINSQKDFEKNTYSITKNSDRMGYRLSGKALEINDHQQMISSPVTFGTIQLLPDGQLIVLMADHQTAGGYPRIGQVISADLPILAQKKPGDTIRFIETDIQNGENLYIEQQHYLQQLTISSKENIHYAGD